jgi:hypothetical protein
VISALAMFVLINGVEKPAVLAFFVCFALEAAAAAAAFRSAKW